MDDKLTCLLEVFGRIKLRMMAAKGVKDSGRRYDKTSGISKMLRV